MTDPDDRTAPTSDTAPTSTATPTGTTTGERPAEIDLDAVERDLDAVETALARLADGTYRTDEVTGAPIPDDVLAADPTARRA